MDLPPSFSHTRSTLLFALLVPFFTRSTRRVRAVRSPGGQEPGEERSRVIKDELKTISGLCAHTLDVAHSDLVGSDGAEV